jgi:predicted dinucleotide-binding enzyme
MKIGIIGRGNVGRALGEGWRKHGHEVIYGSREPATSIPDAVKASDVVVLAVPWKAVPQAIKAAGNLRGRVLLDPTVPLLPDLSGLDPSVAPSGGETVAALAPGSLVVKIFNTTGSANMESPRYNGEAATMFYCGDNAAAKSVAGVLAIDLGFDPVDAGGLSQSHVLETLGLLWVSLAYGRGLGPNIAFKLMRR